MYGFVEMHPNNNFDSVEIPTKCFIDCIRKYNNDPEDVLNAKLDCLLNLELIDENVAVILGTDGVLNEEECLHILQVNSSIYITIMF